MAQTSGFWTTDDSSPAGHQVASYTQAIAAKAWAILASCGGKEGVAPSYLNELVGSVPAAETARIGTGGAVVDGQWYENGAAEDLSIPAAVGGGNTRIDRIVLKCTWADFDVVLEVVSGSDNAVPVAPSLTQTPGTEYDIPLYQALVDTGGTVTLTDERTWAIVDVDASTIENNAGELRVKDSGITAAKIANRARKFLVIPQSIDATMPPTDVGLTMADGADERAYGYFYIPSDFDSGMTVKAIVLAAGTGNIYSSNFAYYGAAGQAYNAHEAGVSLETNALTINLTTAIQTLTLSSAAAGDYVRLVFVRRADNASDTLNAACYITGWLVEYTADS